MTTIANFLIFYNWLVSKRAVGIFSALVQERTERKVYASAVDLILTDTV